MQTSSSFIYSCKWNEMEVHTILPAAPRRLACTLFPLSSERAIFPTSYIFAYAVEDSSSFEEWLTLTGGATMSQYLLPLCVSAGGTTRSSNAAVEYVDTHTHTHAHMPANTHTHIRQTDQNKLLLTMSACCRLFLTLELHQSLLQMRAACA